MTVHESTWEVLSFAIPTALGLTLILLAIFL